ncbi:amino acid adenylation domain-containing protein [Paenibacillus larvae]
MSVIKKVYPLTPMQEGMLYHSLMEKDKSMYFVQMSFKTEGMFQFPLLEKSLGKIIQRHDVFRTIFNYAKVKQPVQVVLKERNNDTYYRDISCYSKEEQTVMVKTFKQRDKNKGFDLTKDALIRLAVFQLGENKYEFIFSFHHIIIDGWCLGTVVKEFFAIYQSLERNRPVELEEVPPFSRYIHWLETKDKEQARSYWKTYIEGFSEQTRLPWTRQSERKGYILDKVQFTISKADTERLTHIAKINRVTLSTLIHAIWGIVLQRYNHSDDVLFGTVVSGRNVDLVGIDEMIGLFINTNPVRVTFRQGMKFDELVKKLHHCMLESEEHSYYPLAAIQADSQLSGELIHHIIAFENVPLEINLLGEEDLFNIKIYDFEISDQTNFDFNLVVIPSDELSVSMKFNCLVYKRNEIETIAGHIQQLVRAVIDNPSAEIDLLELITPDEKNKLLYEFNRTVGSPSRSVQTQTLKGFNTKTGYPKDKTIHELFEEQAECVPDQAAIVYEGQQMTYQELNERANQLARTLQGKGVEADQPVGIMVERSLEMIVGILGILKAGGAYVPIDPKYPKNRIEYMVADSGTKLLLTQSHLQDRVTFAGTVVNLNEESSYHEERSNLEHIVQPNHLAYVIYTSGTTGKPKGVMVEHHSVINTLMQLEKKYPLEKNDSILLKTNYTFDVSVTELFGWFFGEGKLIIAKSGLEKEPEALFNMIQEKKITHINFVPSMLQVILNEITQTDIEKLQSLKYVFSAGEALSGKTIKQFYSYTLPAVLENLYGPTESTIYATQYTTNEEMKGLLNTPIGKPIRNVQAFIVKDIDQLQPIGVAGELCISGVGLARGYLNRPDLTAEKFVDNPFVPGEKMYRTGDLARWLPDGNIEYLGRIDHQVKIRGYRIETGEIEAALLRIEAVQEVIVLAYENVNGDKALCAYYVAGKSLNGSEMREQLSGQLPSYMIPSYFVQLKQMPLTPNGKIDRKALPLPDGKLQTGAEYVEPRTPIEEVFVKVWKSVLGAERVSILDNFYDLGGDSIKSIQVSSRLLQEGYKVEMKHLLKYPTIAQLSMYVEPANKAAEQKEIIGTAPLTPIQSWFFEQKFVDHYFNQAMMLYQAERLDVTILRQVIRQIVQHHDALRTVFMIKEGQYEARIRGIEEGTLFTLDVFDLQGERDFARIIEAKANTIQSSMQISEGPLVKLGLFQCPDGDHLLIVIHHLVVDMVSWRIIFEDFKTGYEQVKNGKKIQLPPKTDSFKLWSERLSKYANSAEMEKERAYWNSTEQTVQGLLPKDKETQHTLNKNSEVVTVEWTEQETEQLLKQTNQAYNTEINDLLLTALGMAIHKWTGMQEIVINLEGHGREAIMPELDITRTVGWFTSQYPVVLQMKKGQDVSERIKTVKEGLRSIPGKGIGYGILRYCCKSQGEMLYTMKPEISFNYLGQLDQDLEGNALQMSPYSSRLTMSGDTVRLYVLNMNGMVQNGKLFFTIDYSKEQYRSDTIQQIGEWVKESLQEVIRHCTSKEKTEVTPSDLTLKGICMEELANVMEETKHIGDIEDIYELTPMQKGMLFHTLADANSGAYFEQMTFDAVGKLHVEAFIRSLETLMQKHPVLRTNIYQGWKDKPLQIVFKHKPCEWYYKDLRKMNPEEQDAYIRSCMGKDKARGFNLAEDALLRVTVLQTEEETHRIIWSFHHILMDGWCLPIIIKEWLEQYDVLLGKKQAKHVMVTPYSRYMEWLAEQDEEEASKYWNEYLANYTEQTVIPYSKSKQKSEGYSAESVICGFGQALTHQLQQIANRNQVTMNTVIQTMWGILLQKYNNSEDVLFGSVVSGRPADITGIESMIGLFINTIPVRVRSRKGMTCTQLMQSMQESALVSSKYDTYRCMKYRCKRNKNKT